MPIKDLVSLRPAMEELERALTWAAQLTDDIPYKLVPVIQSHGKKARCAGWFSTDQWSTREGELVHEITFAAELLNRDPVDIVLVAVHEVVHFWCEHLKLKDTSTGGRHNKTFKEYAEIMGLVCAKPYDSYGFGYTTGTDELRKQIEDEFQPNVTKLNLFRLVKPSTAKKVKTNAWICKCDGLTLRIPAKQVLNATCHKCKSKFEPKEPVVKDGPGPVAPKKAKKVKAHKHEAGLPEHAEDFAFHEHKAGEGHEVPPPVEDQADPKSAEVDVPEHDVGDDHPDDYPYHEHNGWRHGAPEFDHHHTDEYPLHQHDGNSHGNYQVEGEGDHEADAVYPLADAPVATEEESVPPAEGPPEELQLKKPKAKAKTTKAKSTKKADAKK